MADIPRGAFGPPEVYLHDSPRTNVFCTSLAQRGAAADDAVAPTYVVVKKHRARDTGDLTRFEAEVRWLRETAASPHTVQLIGVCREEGFCGVVLPFFLFGSLEEVLHRPRETSHRLLRPLPVELRLCFASDLVAAVTFLHGEGAILRDVKPGNLLIGTDLIGRLADLELLVHASELSQPSAEDRGGGRAARGSLSRRQARIEGTPEYMAPECLGTQRERGSFAADIFGLGVSINEIMSLKPPFAAPGEEGPPGPLLTVVDSLTAASVLHRCVSAQGQRYVAHRAADGMAQRSAPLRRGTTASETAQEVPKTCGKDSATNAPQRCKKSAKEARKKRERSAKEAPKKRQRSAKEAPKKSRTTTAAAARAKAPTKRPRAPRRGDNRPAH